MSALPPPTTPFSAADHPWIDIRTGGQYDQVGLRSLFLDAHRIDDLALPQPPAASALLRIATAITARITGLDDPELTASQWNALRRSRLAEGRFDPDAVHTYFDQHGWDVFDPIRPWLQTPSLRTECDHSTGINAFVSGRPAGRNFAWFSPHGHHTAEPVPTAEALQILLIHHYYGRSGTGTTRTPLDGVTSRQQTSGPLRSSVSFHPLGRTLHETLLAGVPAFTGDDQPPGADSCPWEVSTPPDSQATLHGPVTWPGRQLTGLSRHAILLVPGDDGTTVTDAYLTWATQEDKPITTDPYLAYRIIPETKKVDRRRILYRADASRAWWRDLETLLLAPDEHGTQCRPAIFDTLNDLPEPLRRSLRIRVHGFDQDGKAVDLQWYTAITPPLLNWTQEHDPVKAQRIAECCREAEQAARRLQTVAKDAWDTAMRSRRGTTPPPLGEQVIDPLLAEGRDGVLAAAGRTRHTSPHGFRRRGRRRPARDHRSRPDPPDLRGPRGRPRRPRALPPVRHTPESRLMSTAAEHRASCDAFVAHIHLLCAEPGVRVRLSRGRGRPVEECAPMDRYLARRTAHRQGRRAYYTVASLIAMAGPQTHTPGVRPDQDPDSAPQDNPASLLVTPVEPTPTAAPDPTAWYARPNLGATLATAVRRAGHQAERTESLLHVLTRLSDDQLHRRLPAPVTRLLQDGITPDWAVLLNDLVQRPYRRDNVGLRWRDAFYLATPEPRRT